MDSAAPEKASEKKRRSAQNQKKQKTKTTFIPAQPGFFGFRRPGFSPSAKVVAECLNQELSTNLRKSMSSQAACRSEQGSFLLRAAGILACVVGMPLLRPEPGVPPARGTQSTKASYVSPPKVHRSFFIHQLTRLFSDMSKFHTPATKTKTDHAFRF